MWDSSEEKKTTGCESKLWDSPPLWRPFFCLYGLSLADAIDFLCSIYIFKHFCGYIPYFLKGLGTAVIEMNGTKYLGTVFITEIASSEA